MIGSLLLLLCLIAGVCCGRCGMLPDEATGSQLATWTLYLLLVLVGVGIGGDERGIAALRGAGLRVLLVPLAVALGSLAGAAAAGWLLHMQLEHSLAVGAGFGYYSLSSILISEAGLATLAAVALLSNMYREMATLVLTPLLARYCGALAPIASGGATSMDTTLSAITKSCGPQYALVSLVSGVVLTLLVPVLVPLLIGKA